MSFQRGNSSRSRPQKYQNSHAFKNNLYDTSHKTKTINNIQIANVCKRCKEIIEWKIKYKKYKPLKAPSKCTKCDQKCVKHAYHIMCESCALKVEVCPKCGEKTEIIKSKVKEESLILDREFRLLLKKLPERKRRTFYRYMKRGKKSERKEDHSDNDEKQLNGEEKKLITEKDQIADQVVPLTRDDLLVKLQSLIIANERKKNDEDDYYDDDIDDDDDDEFNNFYKIMNKDVNKDNVNDQSTTTIDWKSSVVNKPSNNNTRPGPAYKLPSLMGYEKHDPSRSRNPAFSIRSRHNEKDNITTGPGPNRYDTYHLTRHGPENPPAFSLAGRAEFIVLGFGPGPGAYHPEKCPPMNHTKRSPAFSLKPRRKNQYLDSSSPGPNAYIIPACLGPKIPHKETIGAFSIAGRKFGKEESIGPGPNAYGNPNYDVIKKKYPAYSLKSRKKSFDQVEGPGPIYNTSYIAGKRPPMFSFGVRHSECKALPFTDMDNE